MKIGFHTDAFNSASWSLQKWFRWAGAEQIHYIECQGAGGPMIEKSLAWLRQTLKELKIKESR